MLDIRRFDSGIIGILNVCIYNVLFNAIRDKCPSKPACRVLLGGEVGGECLHDDGPVQVPAGGDGPAGAGAGGHGDTEECSSDRELSPAVTAVMQLSLMTIR